MPRTTSITRLACSLAAMFGGITFDCGVIPVVSK
jgi:hypothetical protein